MRLLVNLSVAWNGVMLAYLSLDGQRLEPLGGVLLGVQLVALALDRQFFGRGSYPTPRS